MQSNVLNNLAKAKRRWKEKKGATQDSGNEDEYFAIAVLPILPEWVASDEPKYLREDYSTSPCLLLMHR